MYNLGRPVICDTLEPACKVHGCKVFSDARSIFGWSQSKSATVGYNPDVRSARLYGQFSLDKTLTLQPGATVLISERQLNISWISTKHYLYPGSENCTLSNVVSKSEVQKLQMSVIITRMTYIFANFTPSTTRYFA